MPLFPIVPRVAAKATAKSLGTTGGRLRGGVEARSEQFLFRWISARNCISNRGRERGKPLFGERLEILREFGREGDPREPVAVFLGAPFHILLLTPETLLVDDLV